VVSMSLVLHVVDIVADVADVVALAADVLGMSDSAAAWMPVLSK